MSQLQTAARVYVAAVVIVGVALFAVCLPLVQFEQPLLFIGLLLLSSMSAALKVYLPLTTGGSTMSVSYAVDFASLLLLGPHETMLVAAGSAFSQCNLNKKERNPLYRTLFSVSSLIITVQGAGLAFRLLGGTGSVMPFTALARPLVGAATVYFLLNTGLVATAIALSTRNGVLATWNNNFLWSAPSYFVGAGTAALAASLVAHAGYWVAPFTFAPLYLMYRTYKVYMGRIEDEQRHVQQTSDLHLATIEALARAIDAKDQTTQLHIRRVQVYAAGLAKAAGLSEHEIQGVKTAALLHDIGKLAVPEHILSKPGPLTQEEFQKIRIHPQVGAEIIAAVPFPYPVAPLIMSHHERWDGKGYPQGLSGEDIPLGARILTIVDYYDAVTTERPYHKALSNDSALGLLRHEAGRALDPQLVPTFIEMLPALVAEFGHEEREVVETPPEQLLDGSTAVGLVPASVNSAFENIALAHREIYALYEIAQSMGTSLGVSDTRALISSKLSKIIPWSGCALFLHQPELDSLKCRFAAGVDAPRLLNATIKNGEGLAGWVARNRRTLTNANPRVSFDAAGVQGDLALNSALVCPLQFNDTFIGCLALYHVEANHYTEDHRRLIERIGEQAGAVIHNSIVFEQTQEDSLTDPLTGLPNRRSMFVHLSRELSRAERLKGEVALIVMDIDGFKAINDTYGHNVGDHALREMAVTLQGALRPYDLCVRYAGDEFIVVLSDCSREAADAKRHELQTKIAEIQLEVRAGKRLRLAASAGASVFPQDGATYEALLADADQRMYRDKAARRGHLAVRTTSRQPEFPDTEIFDQTTPAHPTIPLPQTLA
ncbi:MAG TPA: diguanylate cyclase [Vicinamibacterales bacterium]|nr:diguanylate cyclase [Vicinamibacterales bacterium]